MFSSRGFIVSGLTFRSLIHFEFIFVYGVRKLNPHLLYLLHWQRVFFFLTTEPPRINIYKTNHHAVHFKLIQ